MVLVYHKTRRLGFMDLSPETRQKIYGILYSPDTQGSPPARYGETDLLHPIVRHVETDSWARFWCKDGDPTELDCSASPALSRSPKNIPPFYAKLGRVPGDYDGRSWWVYPYNTVVEARFASYGIPNPLLLTSRTIYEEAIQKYLGRQTIVCQPTAMMYPDSYDSCSGGAGSFYSTLKLMNDCGTLSFVRAVKLSFGFDVRACNQELKAWADLLTAARPNLLKLAFPKLERVELDFKPLSGMQAKIPGPSSFQFRGFVDGILIPKLSGCRVESVVVRHVDEADVVERIQRALIEGNECEDPEAYRGPYVRMEDFY